MKGSKKIFAAILAGACLSGVSPFASSAAAEAAAEEEVLLNFQVVSDIHYETGRASYQYPKFAEKFRNALAINEEKFPESDALVVAGDVSYMGKEAEYEGFFGDLSRYGSAPVNIVAMGNHEYEWDESGQKLTGRSDADFSIKKERYMRYVSEYTGISSETIYFDTWVNDYHFIVLNTEGWVNGNGDAYISDAQLAWLKRALAQRADENKPIFVIAHQPLSDTTNRSDAWPIGEASDQIKELFADYPQVIYFSGHVHNGHIGYKAVYNAGYGTLVDLPAFQYNELENTEAGSAIGYNVSVYADKTLLTPIDYITEELLTEETIVVDKAWYEGAADAADLSGVTVEGAAGAALTDGNTKTTSETESVMLSLPAGTKVSGIRFRGAPVPSVQGTVGIWGAYDMQASTYTLSDMPESCKVSVSADGETWKEVADREISVRYGTALSNENRTEWSEALGWVKVSFEEQEAGYVKIEFGGPCILSEIRATGAFTPSFPDTYEIQKLYESLMNADADLYTAESIEAVRAEIAALKSFVYGTSISEREVEQVKALLDQAAEKLEEKKAEVPDSSSGTSDSASSGAGSSSDGGESSGGKPSGKGCGSTALSVAGLGALLAAAYIFAGRKDNR